MLYADTSALAKTILAERESAAVLDLLRGLRADEVWSSELTRTELVRAVDRAPSGRTDLARLRLRRTTLVVMTTALLEAAATLTPTTLRSLDAIHVATALSLGSDLDAVLTYDDRMAEAATANGLRVLAPR